MDCPRCGARLTQISLNGELQSVYCERCRFADVESDHTRASAGEETWDDALRRFRTANAGGEPAEDADTGARQGEDAGDTGRDGETEPDDDEVADGGDGAEAPGSESDEPDDGTEAGTP